MEKAKIKGILLGRSGVGKTSFITSCLKNDNQNLTSTTAANFVDIDLGDDDYVLQLWDTAGQEKFDSLTSQYYQNSEIVFFITTCNDDNKEYEDEGISHYMSDIESVLDYKDITPIFIINKIDLYEKVVEEEYQVDQELLNKRIEEVKKVISKYQDKLENGLHLYCTSCPKDTNVQETLNEAFQLAVQKRGPRKPSPGPVPRDDKDDKDDKCKC